MPAARQPATWSVAEPEAQADTARPVLAFALDVEGEPLPSQSLDEDLHERRRWCADPDPSGKPVVEGDLPVRLEINSIKSSGSSW